MTTYSATDTLFDQLLSKIRQRRARVGIIGLGYVGLPLALLYSEQKFPVTGFDIDDLRESPALTVIELLQKEGAQVSYHDPYFPFIGRGRKYDLQMKCAELKNLGNTTALSS